MAATDRLPNRSSPRRRAAAILIASLTALGLLPASGCAGTQEGGEIIQVAAILVTFPLIILAGDHGEVTHSGCPSSYHSYASPCPSPFDH